MAGTAGPFLGVQGRRNPSSRPEIAILRLTNPKPRIGWTDRVLLLRPGSDTAEGAAGTSAGATWNRLKLTRDLRQNWWIAQLGVVDQ